MSITEKQQFRKDVVAEVIKQKEQGPRFYQRAVKELRKKYPDKHITYDSVRWLFRMYSKDKNIKSPRVIKTALEDRLDGSNTLREKILKRIKRKTELKALAELLDVTQDAILLEVSKMQLDGFSGVKLWKEAGQTFLRNVKKTKTYIPDLIKPWDNKAKTIKIGIVSDTHGGSQYSLDEEISAAYDHFSALGITDVYHAGDLTEGYRSSRSHTFIGNKAIGFTDQLEYVVKNYPKRHGITTHVISGNHDLFFMQEGMANIVKAITDQRDDMVYLGDEFARVWLTPKIDLGLVHPDDGVSLNVFNKLFSYVERAGDKLCRINVIGHYHKNAHIYSRGVDAFFVPSFQRQSKWMNTRNLKSDLGYLILTLRVDKNGDLISLNTEQVMLNDKYYTKDGN